MDYLFQMEEVQCWCISLRTCLRRHEVRCFWPEISDLHVVIKDGLGVVWHLWQEVTVEHHLAVVKVEAAHLKEQPMIWW